ncbi:MAG TPA: SGNH/GDSL hydrolase family protein [Pyrinomonadaceae bacterium]|jgi:lysophospholipase L1-like esterase|nr:SGNH/GDSL hydrolase family protein [Pyrinomonadaceae bacterium]
MVKKKSTWKHKLAAVLVSCFMIMVVLFVGEVCCRLFTRATFLETSRYLFTPHRFGASFGNTPNLEAVSFDEKFNTDENGFRYDPGFSSTAAPDAPAMLLIGDSVTFGPGVPEKDTFAGLLRRAVPGEKVYNAAVVGYDTFDYENVVPRVLKDKPDIKTVLIFFCLNDAGDASAQMIRQQTETYEDPDKPREQPSLARRINDFLRSRSKLYLWLKSLLYDSSQAYFLNDLGYYQKGEAASEASLKPLADLNKTLSGSGIKLKVFVMPYEMQMRPGALPEYFTPQATVTKFLRENNIDHYDTTNDFKGQDDPSRLFLFGDPMHLSAPGHKLAARIVCQQIEEKCKID